MASINQSRYIPPPPAKPSKKQLVWLFVAIVKAFTITFLILEIVAVFAAIVDYFKYQSQFFKDGGWIAFYIVIVSCIITVVVWFAWVRYLTPKDMFK